MPSPEPTSGDRPVNSAPLDTDEARTFMQSRLAQFGRIGVVIGAFFLVLDSALFLVYPLEGAKANIIAQIVAGTIGGSLWAFTRRGKRTPRTLAVVDVVSTLAISMVFVALGWALPLWARPELVQLIAVSDFLMIRAFLVPSTTRKTALLASVLVVVIMASTWVAYSSSPPPHPTAPGAAAYTIVAGFFGIATIMVTALTSRTIFGLREKVREAFQLGQYTLLEKLGEGGMGVVYKARHSMLRRPTAVKLLPADRAGEHNLARFEREVQLTSLLTHPNTVSIYDYGRTADGVLYYAMEFLDGIDVQALVDLDGPQEPGRVIEIMRQICGALQQAHGVGLIHRDIKPANVFLCPRAGTGDLVKVLDFGLVRSIGGPTDAAATAADQIVGTPLYMSPEAIVTPDAIDARSDLYALGALGYFLLVGRPPFEGRTAVEVFGHHLHSAPMPPSERLGRAIAPGLEGLILGCLAKSPAERPSDARAVLAALEACTGIAFWTAPKADAWWRAHDEGIRAWRERSASRASTAEHHGTLAVDLRLRATGEVRRSQTGSLSERSMVVDG